MTKYKKLGIIGKGTELNHRSDSRLFHQVYTLNGKMPVRGFEKVFVSRLNKNTEIVVYRIVLLLFFHYRLKSVFLFQLQYKSGDSEFVLFIGSDGPLGGPIESRDVSGDRLIIERRNQSIFVPTTLTKTKIIYGSLRI